MLIQIDTLTGQYVYVFGWNADGKIWNATLKAFETYTQPHFTDYVTQAIEQPGSGSYFTRTPTEWEPGTYTFVGYVRLGATPALGDTVASDGTLTLPGPTTAALASLIASLRALANDLPDSKIIWQESLGTSDQPSFPVDGVNTIFKMKKAPLADLGGVPTYLYYSIVGKTPVLRNQSGVTILDPVNGIIQITPAPDPGESPPGGVYVDYNYVWFTDAKYAEFLNRAAGMVLAGSTALQVPQGLLEAMLQFGLYQIYMALSTQYAIQYASSGGEASVNAQTPAQAFRSLAKDAMTNAQKLQSLFYERQGQREAPAWGNLTAYPPSRFDKISPRQ